LPKISSIFKNKTIFKNGETSGKRKSTFQGTKIGGKNSLTGIFFAPNWE
jgi:hypothetical protein